MVDDPISSSIGERGLRYLGLSRSGQADGDSRLRILRAVGPLLNAVGLALAGLIDWRWGWLLVAVALCLTAVGMISAGPRQRPTPTTTGRTTRP